MPKLKAKRNRFVSMDNEFLTRKDLSLKAKGLLACMLCLPPDWRFSIEGLAYINKESESAISSALRELEQFDYLRRSYPRTEDGKIANAVYTICDIPIVEYETLHGEIDAPWIRVSSPDVSFWRIRCTSFEGIPTVNEMFTVQTTALIQGGGCRESTRPVSGQVQGTLFYDIVKSNGRLIWGSVSRPHQHGAVRTTVADCDSGLWKKSEIKGTAFYRVLWKGWTNRTPLEESSRSHQIDDPWNPKVVKSDFRNNNEVVIHHPIGTFPKWEAAIQHQIFIIKKV